MWSPGHLGAHQSISAHQHIRRARQLPTLLALCRSQPGHSKRQCSTTDGFTCLCSTRSLGPRLGPRLETRNSNSLCSSTQDRRYFEQSLILSSHMRLSDSSCLLPQIYSFLLFLPLPPVLAPLPPNPSAAVGGCRLEYGERIRRCTAAPLHRWLGHLRLLQRYSAVVLVDIPRYPNSRQVAAT